MTSIQMPQLGETIVEGTILKWLKNEGDAVARDEPLFEISTDKVDTEGILRTVERTSRAVVLYEAHRAFGTGAEVSAVIAEEGFDLLDAPIVRLAPPNVPVPFSPSLEDAYLPQVDDIVQAVQKLSKW